MNGNKFSVTREFELITKTLSHTNFTSDIFEISLHDISTKWRFVLAFGVGKLSVHLHKVEIPSIDFTVDLQVSVTYLINDTRKNTVNQRFFGSTIKDHCPNWMVLNYIDYINKCKNCDKTIKILITVTLSENKPIKTEDFCDAKRLISNYGKLFNTDKLSDFKFICSDEKEIPAHRFVLIAHSPVMYKMLMAPMIESKTHQAKLDDIDGDTMLEVLRFLYTGKVEDVKTLAPNLLYCAEKYEMTELKSFTAASMADNLTIDNVLEYYALAERFGEENLLQRCLFYIKQNYQILTKNSDWVNFNPRMKGLIKMFTTSEEKCPVQVVKIAASISIGHLQYPCLKTIT